jgi:hypothetical protein
MAIKLYATCPLFKAYVRAVQPFGLVPASTLTPALIKNYMFREKQSK